MNWEQKASDLANKNGKLMRENKELKADILRLSRLLNNATEMMEFYKKKVDAK